RRGPGARAVRQGVAEPRAHRGGGAARPRQRGGPLDVLHLAQHHDRGRAGGAGGLPPTPRLEAVWSSSLARARDTAAIIAAPHGLPVQETDAFREMGFGEWEGLTRDEVRARFADAHRTWAEAPHEAAWAGAETLAMVRERALAGLAALRAAHQGQTICLVSHGITGRLLLLEALGL